MKIPSKCDLVTGRSVDPESYDTDGRKRCSNCREYKTLDQFNRNQATWDGMYKQCKKCVKEGRQGGRWRGVSTADKVLYSARETWHIEVLPWQEAKIREIFD